MHNANSQPGSFISDAGPTDLIIEEDRHSNVDLEIDIGQVDLGNDIVIEETEPVESPEIMPPAEEDMKPRDSVEV